MDLWALRRIISKGDEIEAWTTREIKQEGDFIRPDKGRRIKVKVRLVVEKVSFDHELGRLRIRGPIVASSNESVSKGSYHSIEIIPSSELTLFKQLLPSQYQLLTKRASIKPIIIVAIDSREAGVGLLKGLSLEYCGTVMSGASGKFYKQDYSYAIAQYIAKVSEFIEGITQNHADAEVILLGPGQTKNQLANKLNGLAKFQVIEGFDLAGEDGVRLAINDARLKSILKGTEYEHAESIMEEAKRRLARDDSRLAIGFSNCSKAVDFGAVESLLLSDELFKVLDEEDVVKLANDAERIGANVMLIDSSTLLGLQVSRMGGAVALLRFRIDFNQ